MSSFLESSFQSDLWTRILPYLPKNDLANLCRTSSAFLGAVRGLLYRQVHMNGHYNMATIDLLLSDKYLAGSVLDFAFKPSGKGWDKSSQMNRAYEAMMAMPSLRELHLNFQDIAMFGDTDIQKRFLDNFNNRTNPLEGLEVAGYGPYSSGGNFALSRLTNLTWAYETKPKHIYDILEASADTLKIIQIIFGHDSGYKLPAEPIWKMTFPQISSFSLNHWEGDERSGITPGFWKFLTLHPSLKSLEITPNNFQSVLTAPDPDIGKDIFRPFLPNLHTFKGEGKVFLQLIGMQPYQSTTLRSLDLHTGSRNPAKVKSLLDSALLRSDGKTFLFPFLKQFSLQIWDLRFGGEDSPDFVRVVGFYLDKWAKESQIERIAIARNGALTVRCRFERDDESGEMSMHFG